MDTATLPDISMKRYDKAILGVLTALLILLPVGGLYALWLVKDALLELAKDSVYFFALCVASVALVAVLWSMFENRRNFILKMKMVAKGIRQSIIRRDPIAAIDVSIDSLETKLEEAAGKQRDAVAARKVLEKRIRNPIDRDGALDKSEAEMQLATMATSKGRPEGEVNAHLVNSERWRRTADQLLPLLDNQRRREDMIQKAREMATSGLSDLHNRRDTMKVVLDAYQAEAAQSRSFRSFFSHSAELETIDIAIDEIERMGSACEAEVEDMLRQAQPLVDAQQLRSDVDVANARARMVGSGPASAALPPASVPAQQGSVKEGVVLSGGKR